MTVALAGIDLARAHLCSNCERVVELVSARCPNCGREGTPVEISKVFSLAAYCMHCSCKDCTEYRKAK